jgi:hypothetical protein
MSFFSKVGANLRDRKRTVATVLAVAIIAMASFLAGTWTSSSGAFTLGPAKASQQHAPNAPKPEGGCCGMPMTMDQMGMPMDKMEPPTPTPTPTPTGTPMPSGKPMPPGMPGMGMPMPGMPMPSRTT